MHKKQAQEEESTVNQVAAQPLAAADSGYAAGATGRLDSQAFGFTISFDSRRRCR
jgi:hypothetical protein